MSPDFLPSLLSNIWSVFLIILFFGGSIFVHELGHFLAARRRGVKVERFSIGFGPAIFKWRGQDGVEYRIAWLPLGGYVALPQLADLSGIEGETETPAEELPPVSYSTRMLVFVAGATFNVIFAFVLAAVLWQIGRPAPENITTTKIGYILPTLKRADGKEVESPATKSKLQVGDIIRRVDGREVSDWVQFKSAMVLSTKVDESGTRDVVLTIERDGKLQDVRLEPERTGDEGFRTIGVISAYTAVVDSVLKGSSGEKLGFKAGDRFIAFDHTPAVSFDQLSDYLRVHRDQPVVLTLERLDGTHVDITLPPTPKDKPHPFNGIMISIPYKLLYHTPWHQF
ncbi:MAG TPA: site-2 protease family protein, partial [Candidatus Didemnitutus sp.]|nr:site-2 protease family protein [Candidatus Didemnitutus sp.]